MTDTETHERQRRTTKTQKFGVRSCNCGRAMRMNSTAAAMAISELRKHDNEAADRIIALINNIQHKDWCGSATAYLTARRR